MSLYVVDSSVAIKCYVPEVLEAEAHRIRTLQASLHAPEFLDVEVAAILWKRIRRGDVSRRDANDTLTDLASLTTITRHSTAALVAPAFDLADRSGRTVYGCLYLALAVQLGAVMVTADEKLANSLAASPWSNAILKLQDVP